MTSSEMTAQRELAPMLTRVWGSISPTIAKMIVERPSLASRLALAPRRVIHAVAVYVGWAEEKRLTIPEIATNVDQNDIRTLLPKAVPDLHSGFFRILGRISGRVLERTQYLRLNAALNGPAAPLLLATKTIHPASIDMLEQVGADRVLLAAWRAVESNPFRGRALRDALAYLRALGVANEIEKLPPGSGWSAIQRRTEKDLGRLPIPHPPFDVPAGWSPVADIAGLTEVGRRFENCLAKWTCHGAQHFIRAILGETVLLVTEAPAPLLAEVERVGPQVWRIGNVVGPKSRSVDEGVHEGLFEDLRASMAVVGHKLISGNPAFNLDAVLHRDEDESPGWERF
jgi:hypothetical protein